MTANLDKRRNKSIIVNNGSLFKQYALKNHEIFGKGIIVVNLLLLKSDNLDELNLIDLDNINRREPTVHQPISYIPRSNFWFKMISLKIKKKHQIDLQDQEENKFTIVFIKDASIERFSIYSIEVA